VERPRRVVRFARLIQRRVRVLGGPAVRAGFGGSQMLPWLPRRVMPQDELHERLNKALDGRL
jgi:hypothetical protein